ncbi:MAG: flagellar filament capping protein FliD [Lachnospiraceae bacterium]|nr:flagellar filament capping protein FliD [Lachnospiraceae bacterium]
MPMRLSGMYSGLDTESIIKELVKAKSTKVDKVKKEKTKLEWKQEAWTSLNTKVKSFFSGALDNLRFSTAYKKKTTSVSNSSAVSVITGEKAMNGVQSLSVDHLAKSGYMTGAKIEKADGGKVKGDTLISELKLSSDEHNTLSYTEGGSFTVTVNGKKTRIDLSSTSTVSEVAKKLNEAGVSANFDENNGRIYIASAESGADNDFAITADNFGGFSALSFLGINVANSSDPNSSNAKTSAEYTRLAKLGTELAAKIKYVNDDESQGIDYAATMEGIDVESDLYKAIKENMEHEDDYREGIFFLKSYAEFANQVLNTYNDASLYSAANRIAGTSAQITLNGVQYTSNSNTIEVNGLTFTCLAEADNITVTTQDDTAGIYDAIKSFFKEYNELMTSINKSFNAEVAKDYEPLTDEEKESMSDKEIEKWEQKIKDSILRKDSSLSTLASTMREAMAEGFEVDGKRMYLSDFGIETLSYFLTPENERDVYHIAGDPDDEKSKGSVDKLKSIIASDPSTVVDFFTQLTQNLYKKLDKISTSTTETSKGNFFTDKRYKTDLTNYESKIKEAEKKLAAYEDKYYKKFSRMEVALSKLESSTSSITAMLGTGK